jgi:hypothetical protein
MPSSIDLDVGRGAAAGTASHRMTYPSSLPPVVVSATNWLRIAARPSQATSTAIHILGLPNPAPAAILRDQPLSGGPGSLQLPPILKRPDTRAILFPDNKHILGRNDDQLCGCNIEFSSAAASDHRCSKSGLQPTIETASKATTATICYAHL